MGGFVHITFLTTAKVVKKKLYGLAHRIPPHQSRQRHSWSHPQGLFRSDAPRTWWGTWWSWWDPELRSSCPPGSHQTGSYLHAQDKDRPCKLSCVLGIILTNVLIPQASKKAVIAFVIITMSFIPKCDLAQAYSVIFTLEFLSFVLTYPRRLTCRGDPPCQWIRPCSGQSY